MIMSPSPTIFLLGKWKMMETENHIMMLIKIIAVCGNIWEPAIAEESW